jgi:prephenate dehydrogenase
MARQAAPQPAGAAQAAGRSEDVLALCVEVQALREMVKELKAEVDAAAARTCTNCGAIP